MLSKNKDPNFQKVIEIVKSWTYEDQEYLMKSIQSRLKQKQKEELLAAIQESRQAFITGGVKSGSVADLMAELEEE